MMWRGFVRFTICVVLIFCAGVAALMAVRTPWAVPVAVAAMVFGIWLTVTEDPA